MSGPHNSDASVWKSAEGVQEYVAGQEAREKKRQAQWRLMGELLPYRDDEAFTVLDIGAGTGPAARAVLDQFGHADAVLADFSDQMMQESEQAMEPYQGRYRYVAFDMTSDNWPASIPDGLGAVVTSQCVHHIDDGQKQQLLRGIYGHLRPGGWYLNFDPVTTDDPLVGAAWGRANERQDPISAEHDRHRTEREQLRYENHIRYMRPLDPQLGYLHAAGFVAVDVYWKHLDYAVYGGARPA